MSDFERPLNDRGEYDAPRMGRLLKREDVIPDLIFASSAERALRTAELVALGCGYEEEIKATRELYDAYPDIYYEILAAAPGNPQSIMLVAHNPGIEAFLSKLIMNWQGMTTGNIGHVALELDHWSDFDEDTRGDLMNFWQPKYLDF